MRLTDDLAVIGLSSDDVYSHWESIENTGISYPLLADRNEELYEALDLIGHERSGRVAKRGLVLLDREGPLQFHWESADNWVEWTMEPLYELHVRTKQPVA